MSADLLVDPEEDPDALDLEWDDGPPQEESLFDVIVDAPLGEDVEWEDPPEVADLPEPEVPEPDAVLPPDPLLEPTLFEYEAPPPVALADKFGWPPLSILDRRCGPWQDRRRKWLSLGLQSELGRSSGLTHRLRPTMGSEKRDGVLPLATGRLPEYNPASEKDGLLFHSASARDPMFYHKKRAVEAATGQVMTTAEFLTSGLYEPGSATTGLSASGTSVFDPVLCEIVYRWFSPLGGAVLDPFAGGSVRGIVASILARRYLGVDLRGEQVEANETQVHLGSDLTPRWVTGDSRRLPDLLEPNDEFDLIFTCPPYADLERYSDNPADLSTMDYLEFKAAHEEIIAKSVARLRRDRFAAWVISDVRDKRGHYRGLVLDTIMAFRNAGLALYNDMVIVDPIGSGAMRAEKQFRTSRKVVRCHQHLLVFVKGDDRVAAQLAEGTAA